MLSPISYRFYSLPEKHHPMSWGDGLEETTMGLNSHCHKIGFTKMKVEKTY